MSSDSCTLTHSVRGRCSTVLQCRELQMREKGKSHLDEDATYMYDKLSFSGALLQDGVDHVVFLLFGNTRGRRGGDVERHA